MEKFIYFSDEWKGALHRWDTHYEMEFLPQLRFPNEKKFGN
jgi:hypothetical protein